MRKRTTINSELSFRGVGLHTGRFCRVLLSPAAAGTGLVFGNLGRPVFLASVDNVCATNLCTVLGDSPDNKIMTVEHLLAALFGLGVDDLMVVVEGGEIPILDGSAMPFVEKIRACGLKQLPAACQTYGVCQPLRYQQGNSCIELTPADSLSFDCRISFDNAVIGTQEVSFRYGQDDFALVAQARTFCRLVDVSAMRGQGLARGGSLHNAVVVSDTEIINPEGLRGEREFAYHKLLDFCGDLALLGRAVTGKFVLSQPGHDVNTAFVRQLHRDAALHLHRLDQFSLPYCPVVAAVRV